MRTLPQKGRPVLVDGRISVRDFDDPKTGQHRWVTEVVAENIVLSVQAAGKMRGLQYPFLTLNRIPEAPERILMRSPAVIWEA